MPSFSPDSLLYLSTCDERLRRLFQEVVKTYDCTILVGHRGKEAQNRAFHAGNSTKPWPTGKHNRLPSMAVDVAPFPIDWGGPLLNEDGTLNEKNLVALKRFYHFGGYVQGKAAEMGIKLRWGGDWDRDFELDDQDFNDLVHFEVLD